MAKIRIFHDVFDISSRVKEIDENYYVVFNTSTSMFEIHNSKQRPSTFCISCPEGLNSTVITKLRKTKIENLDKLLKEIEKSNEILEKNTKKHIKDEADVKAREMFNYAKNKEYDVDFSNSYKTKWS